MRPGLGKRDEEELRPEGTPGSQEGHAVAAGQLRGALGQRRSLRSGWWIGQPCEKEGSQDGPERGWRRQQLSRDPSCGETRSQLWTR